MSRTQTGANRRTRQRTFAGVDGGGLTTRQILEQLDVWMDTAEEFTPGSNTWLNQGADTSVTYAARGYYGPSQTVADLGFGEDHWGFYEDAVMGFINGAGSSGPFALDNANFTIFLIVYRNFTAKGSPEVYFSKWAYPATGSEASGLLSSMTSSAGVNNPHLTANGPGHVSMIDIQDDETPDVGIQQWELIGITVNRATHTATLHRDKYHKTVAMPSNLSLSNPSVSFTLGGIPAGGGLGARMKVKAFGLVKNKAYNNAVIDGICDYYNITKEPPAVGAAMELFTSYGLRPGGVAINYGTAGGACNGYLTGTYVAEYVVGGWRTGGTGGYIDFGNSSDLDAGSGDFTAFVVHIPIASVTTSPVQVIMNRWGSTPGWLISNIDGSTDRSNCAYMDDGASHVAQVNSGTPTYTSVATLQAIVVDRTAGTVKSYTNNHHSSASLGSLGSLTNSFPLRVGRPSDGAFGMDMLVMGCGFAKHALSDADIAELVAYFKTEPA